MLHGKTVTFLHSWLLLYNLGRAFGVCLLIANLLVCMFKEMPIKLLQKPKRISYK